MIISQLVNRTIRRSLWAIAYFAAGSAALMPHATAATITFSNATAFATAANGQANGGSTCTSNSCQAITVEAGSFTGNAANNLALPFALSPGINTLYMESAEWTSASSVTTGGINLFFGGRLTPGISAHTSPVFDKTTATAFTVTGSAFDTISVTNGLIKASGSLSFDDGTNTVLLTGLQWVGGAGSNPYSSSLTVQKLTLSVTADASGTGAPEPGSLMLIVAGLGAVAMFRRFR